MKLPYRPEIDGLRAIAVTSVVLYHLRIGPKDAYFLSGGFLGVDIFFVISGYLITRILLNELSGTGRISIPEFYWRRARRILPPLLFVLVISTPVAWMLLLPSEMVDFAGSQFASILFYANFFWFEAQRVYGAPSGLLQPFLHTWSLAVEEQFYLLFPLVLLVLHRFGRIVPVLVLFAVLSFALGYATSLWKPEFSFFSPVSRAWQLLAGAILAALALKRAATPAHRSALMLAIPSVSLAVIVACMFAFRLSEIAHPGPLTVLPIAATCLLIWFADPREPVTRLLSSAPFVWIGLLSYAIYLWHFPVFAFARLYGAREIPANWALWVALSVLGAILSYFYVEKPFRHRVSRRVFVGGTAAAVAATAVFAAGALTSGGYEGRLDDLARIYGPNDFDNERLLQLSWDPLREIANGEVHAHGPSEHEKTALWFRDPADIEILVIGNSHSIDLFNALNLNRDLFPGTDFARFGLNGEFPDDQRGELFASPNFQEADVVIVAPRYVETPKDQLADFLAELNTYGKPVILALNTAEFDQVGRLPVFDWFVRWHGRYEPYDEVNRLAYDYESRQIHELNKDLTAIAAAAGAGVLSRRDVICDDAEMACDLVTPEGRKAMYDYGHWTIEGARHFGGKIAREGVLAEALGAVGIQQLVERK